MNLYTLFLAIMSGFAALDFISLIWQIFFKKRDYEIEEESCECS